jgi:hypothetical protein
MHHAATRVAQRRSRMINYAKRRNHTSLLSSLDPTTSSSNQSYVRSVQDSPDDACAHFTDCCKDASRLLGLVLRSVCFRNVDGFTNPSRNSEINHSNRLEEFATVSAGLSVPTSDSRPESQQYKHEHEQCGRTLMHTPWSWRVAPYSPRARIEDQSCSSCGTTHCACFDAGEALGSALEHKNYIKLQYQV